MVKRQRDRKHIDMIHCHKDHETERTEQISGANYSGCKGASTISVCVWGGGVLLDSSHARNGQGWGI